MPSQTSRGGSDVTATLRFCVRTIPSYDQRSCHVELLFNNLRLQKVIVDVLRHMLKGLSYINKATLRIVHVTSSGYVASHA